MQAVKYARATSVDEAVQMLRDGGDVARVLAGGTDVIVLARERRRDIDLFVDIKHIPDLIGIDYQAGQGLTLGAATPLYEVYNHPDVKAHYPALVEASHVIGGTAIQGRASLGGNLANSSPAADGIPAMIALGGTAHIAGPNGRRDVPIAEFCTAPGRNVLETGEFIVSLSFPDPAANSGSAWERFIPRNEMDIAVTNAGVYLALDGDTVADARVAIGAVAPTPLLVPAAAEALIGKPLTDETIEAAAEAARQAANPITDMRGTADQRRHLAGVLVKRVLNKAAARARGDE
ncbi:MAG: xanthine dehydrogenase family protein subunit M [Dehalococcoidia bacterium]|nr:xanthine dehydrogenase family protein subunit M [Dehalococcoidia bacterium]MCA9856171.1 xanthine dehydrogenase family protein subunit M [Dehalococcoidia bacterium]MCB9490964.1 xanthine dehydrogenase family protein subunit M [Dehalococcoidia bacterium]